MFPVSMWTSSRTMPAVSDNLPRPTNRLCHELTDIVLAGQTGEHTSILGNKEWDAGFAGGPPLLLP